MQMLKEQMHNKIELQPRSGFSSSEKAFMQQNFHATKLMDMCVLPLLCVSIIIIAKYNAYSK